MNKLKIDWKDYDYQFNQIQIVKHLFKSQKRTLLNS